MFQIGHVSLTSADTYRRDSYCLARVFQILPAPPKQYGVFDADRTMYYVLCTIVLWFGQLFIFSARHQLETWTLALQKTRGMT